MDKDFNRLHFSDQMIEELSLKLFSEVENIESAGLTKQQLLLCMAGIMSAESHDLSFSMASSLYFPETDVAEYRDALVCLKSATRHDVMNLGSFMNRNRFWQLKRMNRDGHCFSLLKSKDQETTYLRCRGKYQELERKGRFNGCVWDDDLDFSLKVPHAQR